MRTTSLLHSIVISMDSAKLFSSGRSQAMRLPRAYRAGDDHVRIAVPEPRSSLSRCQATG
jgi:hypothetical protein